ncbi:MAG: hypothetical protein WC291_00925 [Thermodesulfovibrionales bacterium]|jgi:hypothetical protein
MNTAHIIPTIEGVIHRAVCKTQAAMIACERKGPQPCIIPGCPGDTYSRSGVCAACKVDIAYEMQFGEKPPRTTEDSDMGAYGHTPLQEAQTPMHGIVRPSRAMTAKAAAMQPVGDTKSCATCGRTLPMSEFNFAYNRRDLHRADCRECQGVARKPVLREPQARAGHKICIKCGIEQPLGNFHRHKLTSDGRQSSCKKCCSQYMKKYWSNLGGAQCQQSK